MPKKKQTYEQALDRLEEVIDLMENGGPPLQELFDLYKEGIELTQFCASQLNTIEKEVMVLRQTAEGIFIQTPLDAKDE